MGRTCCAPTKLCPLRYDLEGAAGFGDFFFGGGTEGVRVDGKFVGELAIAENFHALQLAANEAVGTEQIRGHCFSSRKNVKRLQVEHGVFLAERIVEAALGHAAV